MPTDLGRRITREQKMGGALLLIFGVLTVGLGWLQLHNTLYGPFVIHPEQTTASVAYIDEKTKLQQIDTDHDGLSDYDELEFHQTSPYLPDTDSDNAGDKQEIDRGTDPLCPEDQNCSQSGEIVPNVTTTVGSPLLPNVLSPLDILQSAAEANAAQNTNTGVNGGITAAQIQAVAKDPKALRQLLLQSGKIKEADLQQINDATLLSIAAQIAASAQNPPESQP